MKPSMFRKACCGAHQASGKIRSFGCRFPEICGTLGHLSGTRNLQMGEKPSTKGVQASHGVLTDVRFGDT